jgi:multidrug resistance efflux pump
MDAYRLALEQGEKELAEAQNLYRKLALRISQLEAIVTQLRAFVVKGGSADTPLFDTSTPIVTAAATGANVNDAENRAPLWKAIINALNGQKGDFTVPNALKALERTGRIIESKNRLNIIRNTLIQRNDLFGKLGTGHYFVHGFEKKNSEENEKEAIELTS